MPSVRGLGFSYSLRGKLIPAFSGLDARFQAGSISAVVGPSGCGKTSLIRVLAGLEKPTGGRIEWDQDYREANPLLPGRLRKPSPKPRTAVIFQDFGLLPWKTVRRNVELPLRLAGVNAGEMAARVAILLEELGLSGLADRFPARLSGGQRQRVAVARALAAEPEFLLMDEPFSSLDTMTREAMQDSLLAVQKRHGTTILIVTHSIDEAAYLADRIFVMGGKNPGRIVSTLEKRDFADAGKGRTAAHPGLIARSNPAYLALASVLRERVGTALPEEPGLEPGLDLAGRSNRSGTVFETSRHAAFRAMMPFLKRAASTVVAAFAVGALWSLLSALVNKPFLPAPGLVLVSIRDRLSDGRILIHTGASARRIFLSLLVAGPPAWMLGLLAGRVRIAGGLLSPFVYLFHPLPKVAFLPLLLLFLGLGDASKIALMALVIFGQFFVGARDAAKGIPPLLADSVRSTADAVKDGRSRGGAILWHVVLPGTLPELFSALRVSLGTTIAVLFLSETFASMDGLGWYIMDAWSRVDYPEMYAAIVSLALFGLALYLAADALETWACRWRD